MAEPAVAALGGGILGLQQIELTGTQYLCARCRSILNATLNITKLGHYPPHSTTIRKRAKANPPRETAVNTGESEENALE